MLLNLSEPTPAAITVALPEIRNACSLCIQRELCLPLEIAPDDMARIDRLVAARRRLKRGQHIYRAGEPFKYIFVVRTGYFKTDVLTEDGRDQVTGFQMSGDILGLDGIGNEIHSCNAVALEDGELCPIPFAELEHLAGQIHPLQRHLHKILGREIVRDHDVMVLLGAMRAEERIAAFLLNLSQRFASRGYSPTDFHLRMTREEIGSYLGLQLETASRAFSHLQEEGIIAIHIKHVQILDLPRLHRAIGR